ncbi:MAG: class IV adenylate cyclase [Candidatus Fermentibacteraceae bacterium]
MKDEYELKFSVNGFDDLVQVFRSAGALFLDSGDERNLLFDTPDGTLRTSGVLLRLRQLGSGLILTVKQKIAVSGVKGRREHETVLGTGLPEAEALLEALGYVRTGEYLKHRETWRLPCGVTACLDTLSFGLFLELEGNCPEEVITAAERLGFSPEEGITEGYPGLQKRLEP